MSKTKLFTLIVFLMLISGTSFSGTQPTKRELLAANDNFWTCYATDSDSKTFPGLEKDKDKALKTAIEKCSFFSDAADSCRLSQEECEIDEL